MAAFNFPNSPSTNDIHTENGVSWKWNGTVWKKVASPDKIEEGNTKAEVVDTGSDGHFKVETEGTEKLRITSTGWQKGHATYQGVGINTFASWARTGGAIRAEVGYNAVTLDYMYFGTGTTHPLALRTGNTNALFIDNSQNIGVGINNPSSPGSYTKFLEVSDNNAASIIVSRSASGTAHKLEMGAFSGASLIESTGATSLRFKTNSTERLRITSAGKLIVRPNTNTTTAFDYAGVYFTSDNSTVAEGLFLNNTAANTGDNVSISFSTDSGNRKKSAISHVDTGNYGRGDLTFSIDPQADSGELDITAHEKLRITSAGRVGINEASPDRDLHISNTTPYIRVESTSANQPATLELYHTRGNGSDKWPVSVATDDAALTFNVANAANGAPDEKVRITSAGSIGIGCDPESTSQLHIKNTSGNAKITLETNETYDSYINFSGATAEASIGYEPTSNAVIISNSADGLTSNERLRIASDGHVRVGSGDPLYEFELVGAGAQHILIGSTDANAATLILDGDSNGDGSGSDYATLMHSTAGNLEINNRKNESILFKTGSSELERLRIRSDGHILIDTTLNGYGGLKIYDDSAGDYNVRYVAGRNQSATAHVFMDSGRTQNAQPWADATPAESVRLTRAKGIQFQGDTNTWFGAAGADGLKWQTEGTDVAYMTNTQVFATAKHATKVTGYSPVTTHHFGARSVTKFFMEYYTGNSSATYHFCRQISQPDWSFDDMEIKQSRHQYSPSSSDKATRRYYTWYSSHTEQITNYNQNGSGSGTGANNWIGKNQNLGPGGAHQIHASANGGYYRDAWATDYYVSLGNYIGVRLEITIWTTCGLYDTGTYATASDFYPAAFGSNASQSAADNWGGPRGTWFNTTAQGTGTGSSPGCLDPWSTGSNYGQTADP